MILRPEDNFAKTFVQEHKREFAFALDAPIMIAGVRVRATAKSVADDLTGKLPYLEELKQLEDSTQVVARPNRLRPTRRILRRLARTAIFRCTNCRTSCRE
jgi:5-oxoprolinase (ATP-hydrolysing)